MNESQRLADQLERALNGNAWHGPSWREALDGITRDGAFQRPIPEAHTIAEITMHTTTWLDVVRRRLDGESPEVPDADDWPPGSIRDDAAWAAAVARLFEAGRALVTKVREFPAERLHDRRPGVDDTWYGLIIGELQHVLYHAGQAGLLRKSVARVQV